MFPIIAAIVGLILGLIASSHIGIALMCGGMFGMIAWALTGFKTSSRKSGSTERSDRNQPSAPDESLKPVQPAAVAGSRFAIGGTGELKYLEMTPQEFGSNTIHRAYPSSQGSLELLFWPGRPGAALPAKSSIIADPFVARLFLTILDAASNFAYATKTLGVDEATQDGIMEGLVGELMRIKKPDGTIVSQVDIKPLLGFFAAFHDHIVNEMNIPEEAIVDGIVATASPLKSTELLITMILTHYNGAGAAGKAAIAKVREDGFYHPSYALATRMIDVAAHAPRKALAAANVRWLHA